MTRRDLIAATGAGMATALTLPALTLPTHTDAGITGINYAGSSALHEDSAAAMLKLAESNGDNARRQAVESTLRLARTTIRSYAADGFRMCIIWVRSFQESDKNEQVAEGVSEALTRDGFTVSVIVRTRPSVGVVLNTSW